MEKHGKEPQFIPIKTALPYNCTNTVPVLPPRYGEQCIYQSLKLDFIVFCRMVISSDTCTLWRKAGRVEVSYLQAALLLLHVCSFVCEFWKL